MTKWLLILSLITIPLLSACLPKGIPGPDSEREPGISENTLPGPVSENKYSENTQTEASTPAATATKTATPSPVPTLTPTPLIFSGAGDIAICGQDGDDLTAELLKELPGIIFTTGDNNNESGTLWEFEKCFDPSWGQFKERIRPSSGNHEYLVPDAADYFSYFGDAAGEIYKGYYSYDYGNWHIIVLNSQCGWVGGCGPSSPQIAWLKQDLQANPGACSLAYWHDPRWSSGLGGSSFWLDAFWQVLYEYGVEFVINGDDHNYERFAPQDPNGNLDLNHGIREFVVGTGGAGQRPFNKIIENSEAHHSGTFGVLKFELYADHYAWEFLPVGGGRPLDSGQDYCHP